MRETPPAFRATGGHAPAPAARRAKFHLSTKIVLSMLLTYALVNGALLGLARLGESSGIYPYAHEDWLRTLLPTIHDGRGATRILLAGPSEAREGFLYDRFERAFPHTHAFQAGQSLGTFDDFLLTLDYINRTCGDDAMPRVIVLGITPRFVANIPRDKSPLADAINAYSPYYRVKRAATTGSMLVPKSTLQGLLSRRRFMAKDGARYRSAVFGVLRKLMVDDTNYEQAHNDLLALPIGHLIRFHTLPYKYHHLPPMSRQSMIGWMREPGNFWAKAHAWDPNADEPMIHNQFEHLLAIARKHRIRLFVVNLPEHPFNQNGYDPQRYDAYRRIVRQSIGDTPFLDLRTLLSDDDFYDVGHATLPGAVRITDEVIRFIQTHDGVAAAAAAAATQ